MRLNTPVALCFLAGTLSHALPAPQDDPSTTVTAETTATLPTAASTNTAVASDQLAQLAEYAQNEANSSLGDSSKSKRGGCTLSNLAVRREW